jgi:transposase
VARIVEAIGRQRGGALSCVEAAEVLGMSERHFRRLRDRYEAEGAEGLIDRRRGRASGRRAPVDRIEWVLDQYRTRYFDFTAKHFHERLVAEHGFGLSYTWTKLVLQRAGLAERAPKRAAHRKKRPRRPLPGMMLFQDGSRHPWLADRPPLDLIVTLDDATSEIYSAFLVEEEGTFSSFRGLAEVIEKHGLFSSLYTDRGSHYFVTPKAGGKVAKDRPTEVARALRQLGIEHIASYSPEARGRMERVFGTLQQRLPQELRLAGITTVEAANRFLAERFIPAHNRRFAVTAAEPGSAFVPFAGALAEILCVQAERVVGNDNCVRYAGLSLQIPEQAHRHHFVKVTVRVHGYVDGSLAVFHGPRCLARYDADGRRLAEASATRSAA